MFYRDKNEANDQDRYLRRLAKRLRVVAGQRMLDERDEEEITFDVDDVTVHPGW